MGVKVSGAVVEEVAIYSVVEAVRTALATDSADNQRPGTSSHYSKSEQHAVSEGTLHEMRDSPR